MTKEVHREAYYFGLAFFFLSLAFFGGHFYSGDGQAYFSVSLDLTLLQTPTISESLQGFGVYGVNGSYYSKFGLGHSIVLIPFVFLTIVIALLMGVKLSGPALLAPVMVSTPFIGSLVIYLFHRLQYAMNYNLRDRLAGTIFFLLSGLWLSYSRYLFSEITVAFLLVLSVFVLLTEPPNHHWILGIAGAFCLLTRYETILLVIPVLICQFIKNKRLLPLILPLLLAGGIISIYNWIRFRNPFFSGMGNSEVEAFSTPIAKGLIGQFFAPGNGLFLYTPFLAITLLVAFLAFVSGPKDFEKSIILLFSGSLGYLLIHSAWHSWMGGWSWGPRRLIPLLPFLFLSVGYAWSKMNRKLKLLNVVLLLYSMIVNMGGIIGDFNDYYRGNFYHKDVLFSLSNSQIIEQNLGILRGQYPIDNFWFTVMEWPWDVTCLTLFLCLSILSIFKAIPFGKLTYL